tara:strand:+ start:189206 stop:190690 length:1485 start_codon:yes stop_codon:yes gene_type:complete
MLEQNKKYNMKTLKINKLILLLVGLVVFNSCVEDDDFNTPNLAIEEPTLEVDVITIDDLIDEYEQQFLGYIDDLGLDPNSTFDAQAIATLREDYVISLENTDNYISGYVVSNDEAGNFFEEMIIQNNANVGTAGVRVMIDVNPLFIRYSFGQLIYVKLVGLHFGTSNGVLTLGVTEQLEKIASSNESDVIKRSPQIEEIVPNAVNFSDFDESLENVFVQLNNVQFNRNIALGESALSYAGEPTDEFDGERILESCDESGSSIIVSTSTFSDFKNLSLPNGQGSIKGILTRNFFGDTFNLAINTPEDVNFAGVESRCDPDFLMCTGPSGGGTIIFEEDFEGFGTYDSEGWDNINIDGTSTDWFLNSFSNNFYSRISAFNSNNAEANVWLVTPVINMDATTGEELSFDIQANFDNGTNLSVWVSTDYAGDPTTATWSILDAAIPAGPSGGFGDFETVGPVNISCVDGNAVFGFFYEGSDPSATTRYHLDNVEVTGN